MYKYLKYLFQHLKYPTWSNQWLFNTKTTLGWSFSRTPTSEPPQVARGKWHNLFDHDSALETSDNNYWTGLSAPSRALPARPRRGDIIENFILKPRKFWNFARIIENKIKIICQTKPPYEVYSITSSKFELRRTPNYTDPPPRRSASNPSS